MRGVKPDELDNPHELPMMYAHVWDGFLRLNNDRGSNGFSANAIGYLQIEAFCRLTKSEFSAHEIELIKRLDLISLKHINKASK
jgi:hypothetical protein